MVKIKQALWKGKVIVMKFIHIADIHLGAVPDSNRPWGADREKELWRSFEYIIEQCNEDKIDLLLIAGDLFHRQPLLRELKEVDYILNKLETSKVVIIAGNHDFVGARSYYQDFKWNDKVSMFLSEQMDKVVLEELETEVYGLSYCNRDITKPLYDELKPEENDYYHILLAHGGDEKDIPINRRKLYESHFDYIALGHIHKPEVMNDKMAYSGSLEPIDKNEIGEHGYILGELTRNNEGRILTEVRFIPNSIRQYRRVALQINQDTTNGALVDQAKEIISSNGASDIYTFYIQGVRDEGIHFDKEVLKSLGCVLEVEDQSVPDYDFDALYRENADNMIGMFIQRIRDNAKEDDIARKALYYGIEALLGAKN